MTSNLMDTEPGGESTQYESIKTVTVPPAKSQGQFGGSDTSNAMSAADQQAQEERQERGERTAENIRYGQAISEGGMGGQTNTVEGETQSQGFGATKANVPDDDAEQSRRVQGYGSGSGVGA